MPAEINQRFNLPSLKADGTAIADAVENGHFCHVKMGQEEK